MNQPKAMDIGEKLLVNPKKIALWLETYAPDIHDLDEDVQELCIKDLISAFEIKEEVDA